MDEPTVDWEQLEEDKMDVDKKESESRAEEEAASVSQARDAPSPDSDAMDITVSFNASGSPGGRPDGALAHAGSEPLAITNPASGSGRVGYLRENRSPSPPSSGGEGPITPRNNAGPWVFDGSAGHRVVDGNSEMRSLDAAAGVDVNSANQSDGSSR